MPMRATIEGFCVFCDGCDKWLDMVHKAPDVAAYKSVKAKPYCRDCNMGKCIEYNQEVLDALTAAWAEE